MSGRRKTLEEFAEMQRRNAEIVRRMENPTPEERAETAEGAAELLEFMEEAAREEAARGKA